MGEGGGRGGVQRHGHHDEELSVESERRLDVALARARMKLVVLANAKAPWSMMRRYIEYTRGKGAYFSWGAVQSPKGELAPRLS
jgi:tryptophan synthase alpha subunit